MNPASACWATTRLDRVATVNARIGWKALAASEYQNDGFAFLSTPNLKGEEIDFENVNYISQFRYDESPELKLSVGDVLLAKDGSTLGISNVIKTLPWPATVNGSIAVIRPHSVDPRFLRYSLAGSNIQSLIEQVKDGMGVPHLFQWDINRLPLQLPSLHEQGRIADFLDDQVSRLDHVVRLRGQQVCALEERLSRQVDAFDEIDAPWVRASRTLTVLPGNAFPSEMFSTSEADIRLLRGVNVGVGLTRWDDTVYWPRHLAGALRAFRLRVGDVVLGMDRPWISSGLRIAEVDAEDLPALLLQRVALLRPAPSLDRRFMLWSYRSARFRAEVEVDLTGLSVPHLSGPQIQAFALRLPHLTEQKRIADRLDELERDTRELKATMGTQASILSERKRALITAAVTGEFDVTTASGRGVA